jgi:DNA ligase-1
MLSASNNPLTYPNYFKELQFPLFASPKYDGIRAIVNNGVVMSRTWKPLPSVQVQEEFRMVDYIDGELLEGPVFDFNVYNRTQSHVMAYDKPGNLSYLLFDYTHPEWLHRPFFERLDELARVIRDFDVYKLAPQEEVNNLEELLACEERWLEEGAEGLILKSPVGLYKQGRSTWKQGWALKLKREERDEAMIVDFVERVRNDNEKFTNELGLSSRSSHQDGKIGVGMLGKFKCRYRGEIISVAPGVLNHDELKEIWDNRESYVGKIITFQHFPHGQKDKPRQPRFMGFRNKMDM